MEVLTLIAICVSIKSAQTYILIDFNGVSTSRDPLPIAPRAPQRTWVKCIVINNTEKCPISLKDSTWATSTTRTKLDRNNNFLFNRLRTGKTINQRYHSRYLRMPEIPFLKRKYAYFNWLTRSNVVQNDLQPIAEQNTSNLLTNLRKGVNYKLPLYSGNYNMKSIIEKKIYQIEETSTMNTLSSNDIFSSVSSQIALGSFNQTYIKRLEEMTANENDSVNYNMKPGIHAYKKLNISNGKESVLYYKTGYNDKKSIETVTNEDHTTSTSAAVPETNDMEETSLKYDVPFEGSEQIPFEDEREKFHQTQRNTMHSLNNTKATAQDVINNPKENTLHNSTRSNTEIEVTIATQAIHAIIDKKRKKDLLNMFPNFLDKLERKFYATTFEKLTSISIEERRENGISFVQSGLFLSLLLTALSTEVDEDTKAEIGGLLDFNITDTDKVELIKDVLSMLPQSSNELKFRWASRLVLNASQKLSQEFRFGAASALHLNLEKFYGNESAEAFAESLNRMVEQDSGGAMHETFGPEEVSGGVRGVSLTTLYVRGRWRSAPTVLNGTRRFRDAGATPPRSSRMIRINDMMRYANLQDFHALEISYSTPGLTLLMLIPHDVSLRPLAERLRSFSLREITRRLAPMRVAVTMPLYTLRMTLLLPSKLQIMEINRLISSNNDTDVGQLRLSHAVQRLMFWSEAGRNAFKDDGIEWEPSPALELAADRPHAFFVRWRRLTLVCGNFVL